MGDIEIEVKMDLGELGSVTARQSYHRFIPDPVLGIANWTLLIAAVLIFKKNPARFQLLLLSIFVYLVWMLIINHLPFNYWQRKHGYCFFFDVLFFWLMGSIVMLPFTLLLRQIYTVAIEVLVFLLSIGLHLMIYGSFGRMHHAILVISILFVATVAARTIFVRVRRKCHVEGLKTGLYSSLACVFLTISAMSIYLAYMYLWQFIENYTFDWYVFTVYYFLDAARYIGCYLLMALPLTIFVFKHPAYQQCLVLKDPRIAKQH